jgi:hypothetical protein
MANDEQGPRPDAWLNRPVAVELQGPATRDSTATLQVGYLTDVSDRGVTLRQGREEEAQYERFYPWTAIRSIRDRPGAKVSR